MAYTPIHKKTRKQKQKRNRKNTTKGKKKSNSCPKGFHLEKRQNGEKWCVKHNESHVSRKNNKQILQDPFGHVFTLSGPSYQSMSQTVAYKI